MAESLEIRGLSNIVRGDLERIELEGRIGPLMNHDGSCLTPEEMREVVEVVERAKEVFNA